MRIFLNTSLSAVRGRDARSTLNAETRARGLVAVQYAHTTRRTRARHPDACRSLDGGLDIYICFIIVPRASRCET